jgi:hypothetical protein
MFKTCTPFSNIILPDKHMILPQIYIKHPISIKGCSGTILEIINGNFLCDFREFIQKEFKGIAPRHKDFRCTLAEINLVFQFDPVRICERIS